jgi:SAM-dependent methyltransferase
MFISREQRYNPAYSVMERIYIGVFGIPIVGLRIRTRNIFSIIPMDRTYQHILDAGSGTGVISFELGRRFPMASVLGMDQREAAVRSSTHIADTIQADNVEFHKSSIEDYEKNDAFDLLVCVDILEHIKDDVAVLKKLYSMAAPGGILILHVPAMYRRYPVWKKRLNFDVPEHVRPGYEPDHIRDKVNLSGFSICESGFTYGFCETLANNISYMITRARMENKLLYAIAFPFLNLISLLGARARPKDIGAGIYVIAEKR